MNAERWRLKASYGLLAVILPVVVLLASTLCFALNTPFFMMFFESHGTAADVGVDHAGLLTVTRSITHYLAGVQPSMDVSVPVDGAMNRFFNERELAHMVDVRKLFDLVRIILLVGYAAAVALFMGLDRIGGRNAVKRGLLAGVAGSAVLLLFLGVLALTDFESAFIAFHKLFFTNDLWLLNPETDRLIRMLPEEFFSRMVLWSLGLFALVNGVVAGVGLKKG